MAQRLDHALRPILPGQVCHVVQHVAVPIQEHGVLELVLRLELGKRGEVLAVEEDSRGTGPRGKHRERHENDEKNTQNGAGPGPGVVVNCPEGDPAPQGTGGHVGQLCRSITAAVHL